MGNRYPVLSVEQLCGFSKLYLIGHDKQDSSKEKVPLYHFSGIVLTESEQGNNKELNISLVKKYQLICIGDTHPDIEVPRTCLLRKYSPVNVQ